MDNKDLIKRIKEFMNEFDMSVSAFSRKVGIDRSGYYRIIKGEQFYKDDKLKEISNYLAKYGF